MIKASRFLMAVEMVRESASRFEGKEITGLYLEFKVKISSFSLFA
jgi:hypothetical protein